MARIPDVQIERLKQEVSLQRSAEGVGVSLTENRRKTGEENRGQTTFSLL